FSSRRRHTRFSRDWSSDVCSSDLLEAGPVGADARQFGLGGRQLRARSLGLQALVARIELGQHLAGAHVLAGIDVAPRQVAADTERERAFLARADFAGIGRDRRPGAAARLYDQDRT